MKTMSYTNNPQAVLRRLLLLGCMMALASGTLRAQVLPEFSKNTGTTPNNTLTWGGGSTHKKSQQLYRAGDFGPMVVSGKIHKLYFMYGSTGIAAPTTYTNLFVKMGQTTDTAYVNTTFYTGLTTVLSASTYMIGAGTEGAWFEVPLQIPFDYDTSKTLIVEIYYDALSNADNNTGFGTFNGGTRTGRKLNSNSVTALTGNTQNTLPNFGIEIISQVSRNAGISRLVTPVNFCSGSRNVSVEVRNNGIGRINNLAIDWSLDGVPQPRINYNSLIDTLGSIAGNRAVVALGNVALGTNPHAIRAWIFQVDGQPDMMHADDTLLVSLQSSLSGTFTINRSQPTSGTNFNSFSDMAAALNTRGVCGPLVVNVAPNTGPYYESFTLQDVQGTSSSNTIRINGNGNVLQDTLRPFVTLSRTAYTRIDSIVFRSILNNNVGGVLITKESHHDSITNCVFDFATIDNSTSGNYAIAFSNSATIATTAGKNGSHCYIAGNRITCSGAMAGAAHGISVAGASDSNMIVNNLIENTYNYGIYIAGATGTLVSGNEIHRAAKNARVTTFLAIYTTGDVPGTKILGNRLRDPMGPAPTNSISSAYTALRLLGSGTASNPVIVANNIVYNMNWSGEAYGVYLDDAMHNKIYHNTIVFDKAVSSTSDQMGIYARDVNTGTEFKNNIISITEGGNSGKYGFYYETFSDTSMPDPGNNNIYVHSNQSGPQYYGYYNGKAFPDRSAFRAAYPGVEAISLDVDPRFVNPSAGNFNPANRALQGSGQYLTSVVSDDIAGTARAQAPTPGAYEIVVPAGANARIAARVTPESYFCGGNHEIKVVVQNVGTTPVSSIQVHWSLNGVVQAPYTYTGTLTVPGSASGNMDTVTLGSVAIPSGSSVLKAWTVLAGDVNNMNDTLTESFATAMSGNYTVDAATATGGVNFRSFTDLSEALYQRGVCGPVVVDVSPGNYNEAVTFRNHPGAGPGNHVRINGHGSVLQYGTATTTGGIRQLLTLSGTRYMRIDSMVFRIASDRGWGTWVTAGAMYDSITNSRYDMTNVSATTSANGTGIVFSLSESSVTGTGVSGTHCYISGNHIQGPATAGGPYYAVSTASGGNDSNIIVNNVFENIHFTGVYISGAIGTLIQGNEIHRKSKQVGSTFYGIQILGSSPGTRVLGNRIHSPVADTVSAINFAFRGINTSSSSAGTTQHPVLVANNLVYNINQGGTSAVQGIYLDAVSHYNVYHNTVAFNRPYAGAGAISGIYATGSLNGVAIKNNLVSITAGSTGIKYGFYYATAVTVSGIDAQRNNFHVSSTQSGVQNYGYATTAYATQSAFQGVYPALEAGSLMVNPQFANVATGYLLPTNQALQGNGVNLVAEIPEDIEGTTRSAVPTPGAYEIPASAGYNAGVDALVSPGRILCQGQQEIKIGVQNAGSFPITAMTVQWTLNGVAQTPYAYTGSLDVPGGAGGNIDTITLGTVSVPAGVNTLRAWTVVANDVNPANDTLEVRIEPSDFSLFAATDSICTGSGAFMRLVPETGYEDGMLQWERSSNGTVYTPVAGTDTVFYTTGGMTSGAWYRVRIASGTDGCYSDTMRIHVVDPMLTATTGNTRCGTGTAVLSATASAGSTVKWYTGATGGLPIATGNTFTTPPVTGNTTYYAAAALGNGRSFHLGPLNPAAVGTSTSTNSLPNWVVYFSVHTTTVLESVDVFPTAASVGKSSALRIINLGDNSVVRLVPYTATVAGTTTSGQTVTINQKLPPGNYSIGLADNAVALMINSQSGGVYPYASDELSITGHNFSSNPAYYWFFYNWKIGYGCESPRQAVQVTVTTPPPVSISASNTIVCAGDTLDLTATSANSGYTYTWRPGNHTGSTVSVAPVISTTYHMNALDNSGGTHNGCVLEDSITVTVNSLPPAAVTANGSTEFCEGGSVSLIANSGLGYTYQWYRDNALIPAAANSTYQALTQGAYTVRVTGSNTCASVSAPVHVTVHSAPRPVITRNGDVLTTGSFAQYQWRRNGTPVPGGSGQSLTPDQPGDYTVTVTDDNGCSGTSVPLAFQPSDGVRDAAMADRVRLYPNPVTDILYVSSPVPVHISVSSPDGKLVRYLENVQEVHMGDIVPGVYFIRVYDTGGTLLKTEKLIKSGK